MPVLAATSIDHNGHVLACAAASCAGQGNLCSVITANNFILCPSANVLFNVHEPGTIDASDNCKDSITVLRIIDTGNWPDTHGDRVITGNVRKSGIFCVKAGIERRQVPDRYCHQRCDPALRLPLYCPDSECADASGSCCRSSLIKVQKECNGPPGRPMH